MRNFLVGLSLCVTIILGGTEALWSAPPAATAKATAAPTKKTPQKKTAKAPAPKKRMTPAPKKKTPQKKAQPPKKTAPPKKPASGAAKPAPSPRPVDSPNQAADGARSAVDVGALSNITGTNSREPTFIKSDTLTLDATARVFTYAGNVEVKQGQMTLTCGEVVGRYNARNQIETIDARKDVIIVKEDIRGTSQKALFEAATNTITLTENPEVEQHGSLLSADSIKVFLNENRSVAEGAVRVKLVEKPAAEGTPAPLLP